MKLLNVVMAVLVYESQLHVLKLLKVVMAVLVYESQLHVGEAVEGSYGSVGL